MNLVFFSSSFLSWNLGFSNVMLVFSRLIWFRDFQKTVKLSKFPPKPWWGSAGTWLLGIGCGASGDTMEALSVKRGRPWPHPKCLVEKQLEKWRETPILFELKCWKLVFMMIFIFLGVFFEKRNSELLWNKSLKRPEKFPNQKSLHSESESICWSCWSQSTPILLGAHRLKSPSLGLAMKLLVFATKRTKTTSDEKRKYIADILVYSSYIYIYIHIYIYMYTPVYRFIWFICIWIVHVSAYIHVRLYMYMIFGPFGMHETTQLKNTVVDS